MCAINIPQQKRFLLILGFPKRTSQKLPAAATVEAVCIMPLILFFFMSVIWIMDLFFIHSRIGAVVNSVGNEIVAYSYPYYLITDKGEESDKEVFSEALQIGRNELAIRSRLVRLPEYSKVSLLTTLLSDVSKKDEVDILVTYYVKPYLAIPGIRGVFLTNHFYSKAYTGYEGKEVKEDELVYITRTGSVYHTCLDCRVLKVNPKAVLICDISRERNDDGAKYYPCESCQKSGFSGTVFVTPYGNRYHSSVNCGRIKTDVIQIPLSEAGGREQCKFCKKRSSK